MRTFATTRQKLLLKKNFATWVVGGTAWIAVATAAVEATAHGGSYRGPGGGVPTGRGAGGTTGRAQAGISGVSVERWELWWTFNREEFLWSSGLRLDPEPSEDGEQLTLDRKIRERLFPVLEKALGSRDTDLRDTAAFVLGKTGQPKLAIPLLDKAKDDRAASVAEATALALGSLGDAAAVDLLVEILKGPRTQPRTRAYAGLALGFLGTSESYDVLKAGVGFAKKRSEPLAVRNLDVDSARILGMGLTRTQEARRHLIHLATTADSRDDSLKSLLPLALQRSEDPDAAPAVTPLLSDRNVQVRRSAAIALGRLAKPDQKEIVRRLQYAFLQDADNSVKNFAAISLGRIGGDDSVEFLRKHFTKAPSITRAFVAIALGIAGDERAGPQLLEAFGESSEQSFRGASAIALGILGYDPAGPLLLDTLTEEKSDTLRGHLALALGILGYEPAAPMLRRIVTRERTPSVRGEAAEAIALLGDDHAVDLLIGLLQRDESIHLTSATAVALGRMRTPRSFDALLDTAADEKENPTVRAFALAALGRIVDPNVPPTLARVVIDHNYRIEIGYIYDLLTLL